MNFSFENQGTNTYLVYAVGAEDTIDTMSLGMLTNNKIPGLAPAIYTQMDVNRFIKYNISAHVSVKQFFQGAVNKKRLLGVFKGVVDAMLSAEDYMIDTRSILIDTDYIFADVSTCETVLICLPVASAENNQVDLGAFFKSIIFGTQFDQTENCDYVAKIINYLNSTPVFSLTDFKELLLSAEGLDNSAPAFSAVQQNVQQQYVSQKVEPAATPAQTSVPQSNPAVQTNQVPAGDNNFTVKISSRPQTPVTTQVPVPPQKPAMNQTTAIPGGISVPGQKTPQPVAAPAGTQGDSQKKMSFFYLMQHYNKENAAAYKAQKGAKKSGAAPGAIPVPNGISTPGKPGVSRPPVTPVPGGIAVPGQKTPQSAAPIPGGIAVPGQKNPQSVTAVPGGIAVPVQKPSQPVTVPEKQPVAQAQTIPATAQPAYQTPVQPVVPPAAQPVYQTPVGQPMNFGETTVLGGGGVGETTVLSGAVNVQPKETPHLIRVKNKEKILLNKPVFRIGKEKSYVDYFIGDNTAISRSHANFITRDGEYFVTDTNSTNHTYVNGVMIQSSVETKLQHGDKVCLANEDFEFKLY